MQVSIAHLSGSTKGLHGGRVGNQPVEIHTPAFVPSLTASDTCIHGSSQGSEHKLRGERELPLSVVVHSPMLNSADPSTRPGISWKRSGRSLVAESPSSQIDGQGVTDLVGAVLRQSAGQSTGRETPNS